MALGFVLCTIGGVHAQSPVPQPKSKTNSTVPKKEVVRTHLSAPLGIGKTAPNFALTMVPVAAGGMTSLQRLDAICAERPAVLFFFCGCSWCQEVATQWAQFQFGTTSGMFASDMVFASSTLLPIKLHAPQDEQVSTKNTSAVTIVVYQSAEDEVRSFAARSGLDAARTVFLLDKDGKVSRDIYHAEPCPRVFVVNDKRTIEYVNDQAEDAPRSASSIAITSSALSALRSIIHKSLAHGSNSTVDRP